MSQQLKRQMRFHRRLLAMASLIAFLTLAVIVMLTGICHNLIWRINISFMQSDASKQDSPRNSVVIMFKPPRLSSTNSSKTGKIRRHFCKTMKTSSKDKEERFRYLRLPYDLKEKELSLQIFILSRTFTELRIKFCDD